jgi:hypothetical protein
MPRKAKTTEPEAKAAETKPVEAAPEAPKGSKTAAVKKALKANPKKGPKEIAELLQADGWDIKAQLVSVVKSAMKAKKRKAKAAPAPTVEAAVAPVVPKDAVSVGLLVKAKKLAAQFASISEAKAALAALSQLMD